MRTVYVETAQGIWREIDGVMDGPFTRGELGIESGAYIPRCQMLRGTFSEPVSLSFGFGYGVKADNRFGGK